MFLSHSPQNCKEKRACAMHAWILSIFLINAAKSNVLQEKEKKKQQLLYRCTNFNFVHTVFNIFFNMLSRNDKPNQH